MTLPRLGTWIAMPDRETELAEAWINGEHAAIGEVFTTYRHPVRRFLARITGAHDQDLDDLVQQTFLHAHRSIHRFRGESSLQTWLFGIALRASHRMRRGRGRRDAAYARLAEASAAEAGALDVEAREQLRLLASALGALDDDLRVAFVMCAIERIPGSEAAGVLGIPEGTLARRVHLGRQRLRAAIERSR